MKKYSLLLLLSFWLTQYAFGQIPREISYQGVLTAADESPVGSGNYSMTFSLYTTPSGGAAVWQEAKIVEVLQGVFNTTLGDVTPLSMNFEDEYWLGTKVGIEPEMTPRVKLTAAAYSLNAADAEAVSGYYVSSTPVANRILPLNSSGKFPISVLPALPTVSMGGNSGDADVNITTGNFTEITSFVVNQSGQYDISLSANLVCEINGDGDGRYEFKISKGSVTGTAIAKGWWRPGNSSSYQSVTISLTGVDGNGNGPSTYYLSARKYDGAASKNLLVFIYYLNGVWVTN